MRHRIEIGVVTEDRHQRNHAGAAPEEEDRARLGLLPDEVPADRSADLELIADREAGEIGRDLTVVESYNRQLHPVRAG